MQLTSITDGSFMMLIPQRNRLGKTRKTSRLVPKYSSAWTTGVWAKSTRATRTVSSLLTDVRAAAQRYALAVSLTRANLARRPESWRNDPTPSQILMCANPVSCAKKHEIWVDRINQKRQRHKQQDWVYLQQFQLQKFSHVVVLDDTEESSDYVGRRVAQIIELL